MRERLQNDLAFFQTASPYEAGQQLFSTLGVTLRSKTARSFPLSQLVKNAPLSNRAVFDAAKDTYFLGQIDDNSFGMFQNNNDLETALEKANKAYKGIFVFAVQLVGGFAPTRTQLAALTRAMNQASKEVPVIVLVCYEREGKQMLSFNTSERTNYKQTGKSGEKIGRISMLKDINLQKPHAGHLQILEDMQISSGIFTFEKLHTEWRKVFDTQTLNNNFYKDLSYWFFSAVKRIEFLGENDDKSRSVNTIKIISRLIFIWFLKEKGLISEKLFQKSALTKILKSLDNDSNSFYVGILSNLFFRTVNEKIENRFKSFDVVSEMLFKDFEAAKGEFNQSPFVNGGLFDPSDAELCATVQDQQKLKIPNELFFGTHKADLHEELNDKKSTNVDVCGLIDILNSYKFTVEENTPLESEVALDPELLGKIFENLLASYNDETKTSARKATGSYYTPREIVEYMVDQSLIAYLENKIFPDDDTPQYQPVIGGFGKTSTVEADLFGTAKPRQFTLEDAFRAEVKAVETPIEKPDATAERAHFKTEITRLLRFDADPSVSAAFKLTYVDKILDALDAVKILDPAVGSGAFPMGILQKMTLLLERIDPDNKRWLDRMLARISNAQLRKATSDKWKNESTQYLRKLGIIENAIYGIDIQPVAVQIAKLRFFISLVIEQDINDNPKKNYGIQPLPNLDFKFVCANTLIDVPSVATTFLKTDLQQFQTNVSDYFSAVGDEKKGIKKRIEANITTIWQRNLKFLEDWAKPKAGRTAKEEKNAQKQKAELANAAKLWATYTNLFKDETVGFFNTQYFYPSVFEQGGFDIVIGNPPYVNLSALDSNYVDALSKGEYKTFSKSTDLYCLFYEKGWLLNNKRGILCYITSNRFCFTNYGIDTRRFLSSQNLKFIININEIDAFESANVGSIITQIEKSTKNLSKIGMLNYQIDKGLTLDDFLGSDFQEVDSDFFKENQWSFDSNEKHIVKQKILDIGVPFSKYPNTTINRGITTGLNNVFVIDHNTRHSLINQDLKNNEIIKPVLKGANIKKFNIVPTNNYLIYSYTGINIEEYPSVFQYLEGYKSELEEVYEAKHGQKKWYELRKCSYYENFSEPKLVWTRLSSQNAFAVSLNEEFTLDSSSFAISDDIYYLAAILNSKVVFFYFKLGSVIWGKDGIKWFGSYFDNIPIPIVEVGIKTQLEQIVKYILYLKSHPLSTTEEELMPVYFEQLIDGMVYELYFEAELKAAQVDVLAHLGDLPPLSNFETDAAKMSMLTSVFTRLYDPRDTVRNRLTFMRNVKEIAIIEGKK